MPVSRTLTTWPTCSSGRSCSATCPRSSTSPFSDKRNRASPPGVAVCPTSTLRVKMIPSVGARTTARAKRACASASSAAATLTLAAAVTAAGLLEPLFEISHLWLQYRHIQTREHLAAFHMIAGLDVNRRDLSGIALDAYGHVVSSADGTDDAHRRRHAAYPHLGDRHGRNGVPVGGILHTQCLRQSHGEYHDQGNGHDHDRRRYP